MPSISSAHAVVLAVATFLGMTVYAFCLLFAAVVMPGLDSLDDEAYLRAFQVIDGTIQNNQPLFITSWVGSLAAALGLAVLTTRLPSTHYMLPRRRVVMVLSCIAFLLGHVITVSQHIPRNNSLHSLDIDQASTQVLADTREDFAGPWCVWNNVRTILFGVTTIYWMIELVLLNPYVAFAKEDFLSFETPPEVENQFSRVV